MTVEQSQPIPVEKGWPLLGVLPKLFRGNPYEYLKNVMLERGGFVQLNFVVQQVYLISHPDYVEQIMAGGYRNYRKADMFYNTVREVGGNGLVAINTGDLWLRQRRMIQPHLHRKQLIHLFSDMSDAISEILNSWLPLAENHIEIELSAKMAEISSNVLLHTMFGKSLISAAEVEEISLSTKRIMKYIGESLYSSLVPKWFPIPGRRQFLQDLKKVKETVDRIITKCRQDKEMSASLIQMLINAVDEESHEQMTDQQLFDETITLFIAGYETTATALTWVGVIIQKYPDVLEKLRAEIDQVLGTGAPSFEDVPRLTYTRQVFMETLRMYTPGPLLTRSLNEADQLGGHHLPADALLILSFHGVHHNPSVWANPEVFDPERFTPERMAGQHPFAYLPFGAGPRKCAGNDFALLEGTLAIAMMLQKYNFNILPNQTFDVQIGGIQTPHHGVKATLSLRVSTPEKTM